MKVLVTGSTGFVGSHLCEFLVKNGHQVFALARNKTKLDQFNIPGKFIHGDLSASSIAMWIKKLPEDLDVVIHVAAIVHSFNVKDFYEVNYRGTERLVQALKKKYKYLRFTLISSLSASGTSSNKVLGLIKEDDIPRPVNDYGHSKLLAELVVENVAPRCWLKNVIRAPIVLGPRDTAGLELFKMVSNGIILIPGTNGKSKQYSFICIHDLVEVIVKSLFYKPKNSDKVEIFNTSYPTSVSLLTLMTTIKKTMKKDKLYYVPVPVSLLSLFALLITILYKIYPQIDFRFTPDKVPELRQKRWVCSSEKTQTTLKMVYNWNLEKTIESTHQDYIQRMWL
ncbi:MAG: NAD(P)-dependent oxidoreductase [Bacteriovoracaceae bacterium]|nr:NAD(P)-dependent oxidoreductase [Bacteriovoracaceae bacterium]